VFLLWKILKTCLDIDWNVLRIFHVFLNIFSIFLDLYLTFESF
jgi:hypothetical protein